LPAFFDCVGHHWCDQASRRRTRLAKNKEAPAVRPGLPIVLMLSV
jgi:hypothetical protein